MAWEPNQKKDWSSVEFQPSSIEARFMSGNVESLREFYNSYNSNEKNRPVFEKIMQRIMPQMSVDEFAELGKKLYQIMAEEITSSHSPIRGTGTNANLAGKFAEHHFEKYLDNLNLKDIFKTALSDAQKNLEIAKNNQKEGSISKPAPVTVKLTAQDLEKIIEPLFDVIKGAIARKEDVSSEQVRIDSFAKFLEFHMIKSYVMDKNTKIDKGDLLRVPFKLPEEVVTQLYKEYVKLENMPRKQLDTTPDKPTPPKSVGFTLPNIEDKAKEKDDLRPPTPGRRH